MRFTDFLLTLLFLPLLSPHSGLLKEQTNIPLHSPPCDLITPNVTESVTHTVSVSHPFTHVNASRRTPHVVVNVANSNETLVFGGNNSTQQVTRSKRHNQRHVSFSPVTSENSVNGTRANVTASQVRRETVSIVASKSVKCLQEPHFAPLKPKVMSSLESRSHPHTHGHTGTP